jgi:hypothetical protein
MKMKAQLLALNLMMDSRYDEVLGSCSLFGWLVVGGRVCTTAGSLVGLVRVLLEVVGGGRQCSVACRW